MAFPPRPLLLRKQHRLGGIVHAQPAQSLRKRLLLLLCIPVLLVGVGTIGYAWIDERYILFYVLYMAVMAADADKLYTTMSARLLNKDIYLVARMEQPDSEIKWRRAGANRVVSPYLIGCYHLAHAVLRPAVVDFIELATRQEHVDLQ